MTLAEAARRDPRLLVLRCVEALEVSLERETRNVPRDGRFHVRIRGRVIYSGPFAAALARYNRARDAQLWRRLEIVRRRSRRPGSLQPAASARALSPPRTDGRYPGQRRVSWRRLVPLRPPEPRPPSAPAEPSRHLRQRRSS
jgi:hypothetical protein